MQNVTLDSSDGGFSGGGYVRRRRRPLRSRTCDSLFTLLFHFRENLDELQCRDVSGAALQLASKESELVILNETDVGDALGKSTEGKEPSGELLEVGFDGKEAVSPVLDQESFLNGNIDAAVTKITGESEISVVKNQSSDCDPEVFKNNENVRRILDIHMDEFGTCQQLPADDKMFFDDFPEVLRSCMGTDVVVESTEVGVEANGADSITENIPDEVQHELKMKEMELELEKLIGNSSGLASSSLQNGNGEMEEGEISGDSSDPKAPLDLLSEDAILVGESPGCRLPASTSLDSFNKETGECSNQEMGHMKDAEIIARKSESLESMLGSDQNQFPLNISSNNVKDTQDGDARKKKRKRPSLEQRAKKKKKERIRRAQKNRENGVKRLKLLPVLKQKTKEYCRHYLMGRCSEGEKCNFSHDTVPLTKSKPCGHFARNSCLKGDDCPYDHQLSKYPCKNYSTTGFCSRGTDCLFSHESSLPTSSVTGPELSVVQSQALEKGVSSIISKVTGAESKFPSPLNNPSHVKTADANAVFHQTPGGSLVNWGAQLTATKPPLVTPPMVPKGVSFLCNKSASPGDKRTLKQNEPSMGPSGGSDSSRKAVAETADSINKLNEVTEKVAPRIPRGVNFLSFTKPSDDLNSKIGQGKGKSVLDDITGIGKPICASNANEVRTTTSTENVSSSALDGVPSDGSVLKQRTNSDSNRIMASTAAVATTSARLTIGQAGNPCSSSSTSSTPSLVQTNIGSTLAFAAKLGDRISTRSSSLHRRTE